MGINWFEGGRRITYLFQGAAILGGLFYVVFGGSSRVTFETLSPDDTWAVASEECQSYRDGMDFLNDVDLGNGHRRDVTLCFRGDDGGIPYEAFNAPRPADAPPPIRSGPADPAKDDVVRMVRLGAEFSPEVTSYTAERKRQFTAAGTTGAWMKEARDGLWWSGWRRVGDRFGEALPWVLGLCFGLWLFATVIGWIARGFAGVPSGADFRVTNSPR